MYKIIPWSEDLELSEFYEGAADRGFENNASQHMLVDCFRKEAKWQTWILYYNNEAVGIDLMMLWGLTHIELLLEHVCLQTNFP